MASSATRLRAVLVAVVGLLMTALPVALVAPPTAGAASATVVGELVGPGAGPSSYRMVWFDAHWGYLGERTVRGDIYSVSLPPGTYQLQFFDQRPAYDLQKYAPAHVTVTVGSQRVQRDVRLHRGAAITGTVRAGGRPAAGARVVAANNYRQSFETRADSRGRFAVGGLPTGKYSVFTYDRRRQWVDKSVWVAKLLRGRVRDVAVDLRVPAGSLLVELRDAEGRPMSGSFTVTAVSDPKRGGNGQFWTARARGGLVTFRGLYPGGYTMVAPGVGSWLPQEGRIAGARVRSGHADLVSRFTWTRRGATLSGLVVDAEAPDTPLEGARVRLYDAGGRRIGETLTDGDGLFLLGGQLTTQHDLTLVVEPKPDGGGWMQGRLWCKFESTAVGDLAVTTGEETFVDPAIELPHSEDNSAQCAPSEPAAR